MLFKNKQRVVIIITIIIKVIIIEIIILGAILLNIFQSFFLIQIKVFIYSIFSFSFFLSHNQWKLQAKAFQIIIKKLKSNSECELDFGGIVNYKKPSFCIENRKL